MLKIVLLAYSRGIVSSRAIERVCRENVVFMAISGDSAPRFTTIAKFVRELGEEVSAIFTQVLLICDRQGLICDKTGADKRPEDKYQPSDFCFDPATNTCICPAGKKLYSSGSACKVQGRWHHKFKGTKRDCVPCHLREQCLRHPERTEIRQVAFFDKNRKSPLRYTERMKQAIDSDLGRKLYGRRIAIVEPVFGNLRHNKRLDRFTLRTQPKVDAQWNLYCLVHNIEKLAHHGYGRA